MLRFSAFLACCPKEWNLSFAKVRDAATQAASLGFNDNKRIVFLLAKGVGDEHQPVDEKKSTLGGQYDWRFNLITKPPNGEWRRRRNTLNGILDLPVTDPHVPGDQKTIPSAISFETFCRKHPEWANRSSSFVFFRDHPSFANNNALIQRVQLFGTCVVHAPIVLQHYVVAMANEGATTPTVDIPLWLRRHAPREVLEGVVFGKGANIDQVRDCILVPRSLVSTCGLSDVESVLRSHGPVVLPMWRVTDDFKDVTQWSHTGPLSPSLRAAPDADYHAMLAVGCRRTQSGETRLLLQNWWREKQFVEVDEKYYNSCMEEAPACFVKTPQPRIPPQLDTTDAVFSVTAVDGAGVSGVGVGPAGVILDQ